LGLNVDDITGTGVGEPDPLDANTVAAGSPAEVAEALVSGTVAAQLGAAGAGSPRRRPPNSSQLIKEEGSVGDTPAGSRYWCISRVRDEVACRNISMVELLVGRCLDEAYLGIGADVLIRPATAAPVDPRGRFSGG
jgi:hypothetical protein